MYRLVVWVFFWNCITFKQNLVTKVHITKSSWSLTLFSLQDWYPHCHKNLRSHLSTSKHKIVKLSFNCQSVLFNCFVLFLDIHGLVTCMWTLTGHVWSWHLAYKVSKSPAQCQNPWNGSGWWACHFLSLPSLIWVLKLMRVGLFLKIPLLW